jgi:uncharacterized protein YqgC (DUF456 family)
MTLDLTLYGLLLLVSLAGVMLNIFSLPGNWIMFIAAAALSVYHGWDRPGVWGLLVLLTLLVRGEIVEFCSSLVGARQFGASRAAMWCALAGGIVGALIGVPVWGIGSLLGAIVGSFGGALLCELIRAQKVHVSVWAAVGAALGRTIGLLAKLACGLTAWALLIYLAWPG